MGAYILSQYFLNIYDTVKTMLSGMSLTLQHMRKKKELVATMQYPNEKWPIPERNIGFDNSEYNVIRSRLHVDIDDCIGCLQCEKACPVDCIKIDTLKPAKGSDFDCGKTSNDSPKKMLVPRFTIDMSECMYCNLCVYPCPEECIYMVGGPNEPKHDIDYEFSKYSKHDLIFEFSNVSETQILEAGGDDYLAEKKAVSDKVKNGEKLMGGDVSATDSSSESPVAGKRSKGIDKAFVLFKEVSDSKMKAVARKAIAYGRRNLDDPATIVSAIKNQLNDVSADMESALNQFSSFDYGDSVKGDSSSDSVQNVSVSTELFNIKEINIVEDKLLRANLKKIYMNAKKNKLNSNIVVDEMLVLLKEKGVDDSSIVDHLNSLKLADSSDVDDAKDSVQVDAVVPSLFDMKLLNDISDKIARGTAKKIYIANKKDNKSSVEVISEIKKAISDAGLMNDDIENLLGEIE
tara:strand:- start:1268 stop:2650 length:1383 start_codon:yes stop_codon:yes gene_type:complete